jgi:chromate reductase, NAD(P)H dehydrogenase (quinone)
VADISVLTICGSLRRGSYNAALIRALPALAPSGMRFESAPRFDSFPHYNHDEQTRRGFPPAVETFAAAIRAADGVVIVTPEYNWTIPGALKNAIDWVSRMPNQPFKGKPVALQSCSGGPLGGARMQYHMRMALTFLSAFVFGTPEVFIGLAHTKFDEKTLELRDESTRQHVAEHLQAFGEFVIRLRT